MTQTRDGAPSALLLDLDGTVYQEGELIPGAAEALARLDAAGLTYAFVTNTTRKPRRAVVEQLEELGITASPEQVLTAPVAAATRLREQGVRRLYLLLAEATWEDFADFELSSEQPEWVVVGDLGDAWDYAVLNDAFQALMAGAELLAIQKNRYWSAGDELALDAGPFVAALEYASGKEATLVGKPSTAFFTAAAAAVGCALEELAMVGDDLEGDVAGAQQAGLIGIAVRTGKYRPQDEAATQEAADAVLDSIADLPTWLEI